MLSLTLLTLCLAAGPQEKYMNEPRTITVSGEAELKVAPDEVTITVGVDSRDKDLSKAKKDNDERIKRIIAAAKNSGVEERRIATDRISIEPHYESSSYSGRGTSIEHYAVQRNLQLTLREVARFDAVLSALVEAGANVVHDVQFTTTELRKHRDQARELAMKAAGEKAAALAKTMGMKPGTPRSITEGGGSWWASYGRRGGGMMSQNVMQMAAGPGSGSGDGTAGLGMIGVSASVTIVFDLE